MADFEQLKKAILYSMKDDPFSSFMGIEYLEFEPDRILARIPFKKDNKNVYGTTHGGVLYGFADIVAGVLACSRGKVCTTSSGSMNYLSPAVSKDYIYCEARIIKDGGRLVVLHVEIKNDEGKLLDDGTFTLFKADMDIINS